MPNIFNNKVKAETAASKAAINSGQNPLINSGKINISNYRDPSGLNLKNAKVGLWFLEKRQLFLKIFYGLLILIAVITWPLFIYTFGEYLIVGMNNDEKLLAALTQSSINLHSFSPAVRAQNIVYKNVEVFILPDNKVDLAAEISNPNEKYWGEFNYYFSSGGQEYEHTKGFILPGETKFLLTLNQPSLDSGQPTTFHIVDLHWRLIDPRIFPDWEKFKIEHLNIPVTDISFTPARSTILSEKLNLNELEFNLSNNTAYNYAAMDLIVVLYANARVVGVNKYSLENVLSGQSREIKVTWEGNLNNVASATVTPEINITRNDIYRKF